MSKIWKGIVGVVVSNSDLYNFFRENMVISIGNDRRISFWDDVWMGEVSLRSQFPRLYQLSEEKEISLSNLISRKDLSNEWSFRFRRSLHAWEEEENSRLIALLGVGPCLHMEQSDSMR